MGESGEDISLTVKCHRPHQVEELNVPSDLTIEALSELVSEIFGIPMGDVRLVWNGRVLRSGTTLASYSISNGATIMMMPKRGTSASEPAADPNPPDLTQSRPAPSQPGSVRSHGDALRGILNSFQNTLSQSNHSAARLQVALNDNNIDEVSNSLNSLKSTVGNLVQRMTDFGAARFESMESFVRSEEERSAPPPVFSVEEVAEMARISGTLAEYARGHRLADSYAASDLYASLDQKVIVE
jgi:hypothetical protein